MMLPSSSVERRRSTAICGCPSPNRSSRKEKSAEHKMTTPSLVCLLLVGVHGALPNDFACEGFLLLVARRVSCLLLVWCTRRSGFALLLLIVRTYISPGAPQVRRVRGCAGVDKCSLGVLQYVSLLSNFPTGFVYIRTSSRRLLARSTSDTKFT